MGKSVAGLFHTCCMGAESDFGSSLSEPPHRTMTDSPIPFFPIGGNLFRYSVAEDGLGDLFQAQLSKIGKIAFDTAEAYENASSERMIGATLASLRFLAVKLSRWLSSPCNRTRAGIWRRD